MSDFEESQQMSADTDGVVTSHKPIRNPIVKDVYSEKHDYSKDDIVSQPSF